MYYLTQILHLEMYPQEIIMGVCKYSSTMVVPQNTTNREVAKLFMVQYSGISCSH